MIYFKRFFLLIFLICNFSIYSYDFSFVPLTQPLEVTIYKNYLVKTNPAYYTDTAQNFFYKNAQIDYPINFKTQQQPNYLDYYLTLNYYHATFYQKKDYFEFELIPYLKLKELPWSSTSKTYNLRSSISYGFALNQKQTILGFVGFINEQKLQNNIQDYTSIIEYGKIFFTPGIQLRSSGAVLKTFLEMPLYQYDLINKTQSIYQPHQNNIEANIQIQIAH